MRGENKIIKIGRGTAEAVRADLGVVVVTTYRRISIGETRKTILSPLKKKKPETEGILKERT